MCSAYIMATNSCYIDNLSLAIPVLKQGVEFGIIGGTLVGILLLFTKS